MTTQCSPDSAKTDILWRLRDLRPGYGNVIQDAIDEIERLRAAMLDACDLLTERRYGQSARSPGHNARLLLEGALKREPIPDVAQRAEVPSKEALRLAAIETALHDSFPHFQEDADITADTIRSIGKEYQEMAVSARPQPAVDLPDEEAAGKTAVRLLDQWTETTNAERATPYHETMALLGKPNSAGWVWAHEVRHERNFDAEQEQTRKLATECVHAAEAETERLRAALTQPQGVPTRDQIATIIAGDIYGTPDECVGPATRAAREMGLQKADAVLALSHPECKS